MYVCVWSGANDQCAWRATSCTIHAWRRACTVCQWRRWIAAASKSVHSMDVLWWKAVSVQAAQVDHCHFTPPALWRQRMLLYSLHVWCHVRPTAVKTGLSNVWFLLTSLGPSQWNHDRIRDFCKAHLCDQHTDVCTYHATLWCVGITCVYLALMAMLVMHKFTLKTARSPSTITTPSNTLIPCPTPLTTANGIRIHSAVLPQYTFRTHRHARRLTDGISNRSIPVALMLYW